MSVPVMLAEVVVRIGYAFKRIKEGHSIKESVLVSLRRDKHPKLATMLFIGHSAAVAINAGKVCFTHNPMRLTIRNGLIALPSILIHSLNGYYSRNRSHRTVMSPVSYVKNLCVFLYE